MIAETESCIPVPCIKEVLLCGLTDHANSRSKVERYYRSWWDRARTVFIGVRRILKRLEKIHSEIVHISYTLLFLFPLHNID